MIVLEFKAQGKTTQYQAIDEAIRTAQFIRNKCIRFWMDNRGVGQKELYRYNTALRAEFPFVKALNSHACQAAVERAYSSIGRFYDNCRKAISGKKGYPQFKKNCRSVEYKTSGWKLSETRKQITFTDHKRKREEHAKKVARCVIKSNDLVAYEDLRIKNLVKNHCLAKSINDAGWYQFRKWLEHFGMKFGKITIAVNPAYTSQKCSGCGAIVKKSLSMRTHICKCGFILDRDWNAALNILKAALSTVGHTGTWILDPNASGDLASTLAGAILSGQAESMNEESPSL